MIRIEQKPIAILAQLMPEWRRLPHHRNAFGGQSLAARKRRISIGAAGGKG